MNTKALISTLLLTGLGIALSACVPAPYPNYAYDSGYSGDGAGYTPAYYSAPAYYTPTYYSAPAYYTPAYYSAPAYYYGPSVGVYYGGGWRGSWDRDRRH